MTNETWLIVLSAISVAMVGIISTLAAMLSTTRQDLKNLRNSYGDHCVEIYGFITRVSRSIDEVHGSIDHMKALTHVKK